MTGYGKVYVAGPAKGFVALLALTHTSYGYKPFALLMGKMRVGRWKGGGGGRARASARSGLFGKDASSFARKSHFSDQQLALTFGLSVVAFARQDSLENWFGKT